MTSESVDQSNSDTTTPTKPIPDTKTVIRVRGLPYTADDQDIRKFFRGYNIKTINWGRGSEGRHNGTCHVEFIDSQIANNAMSMNKQYVGERYVELFLEDFAEFERGKNLDSNRWLKLRGVPFRSTAEKLAQFFAGLEIPLPEVHIVVRNGKASGEAIAHFASAADLDVAMKKNKHTIGRRYVELIPVDDTEAKVLMSHTAGPFGDGTLASHSNFFVTLRGLPYKATNEEIKQFLEGIDVRGIYIRYDRLNRPSGEAFIDLGSEQDIVLAVERNHKNLGTRYVEVFKTDKEEVARKLMPPEETPRYPARGYPRGDWYGGAPYAQFDYGMPRRYDQPYNGYRGQPGFQVSIDGSTLAAAAAAGRSYITVQIPTGTGGRGRGGRGRTTR